MQYKTFIDLFCGIGGFHKALTAEGLQCLFAAEINNQTAQTYKANYGLLPRGDITKIDAADVPPHDVLCGGFPCQAFSIAGNRQGFEDARGTLFFDIMRIAKHHQPKIMLLENVPAIFGHDDGKTFKIIANHIDKLGYDFHYALLNAAEFGIPQARARVYFVCLRKDICQTWQAPTPTMEQTSLADSLLPDSDIAVQKMFERTKNRRITITHAPNIHNQALRPLRIGFVGKEAQEGQRIYATGGVAITQKANGGGIGANSGLYYFDGKIRRLTIIEKKRIMGFDDDHILSAGTAAVRELGNAVIPRLISLVWRGIGKGLI